MQQCEQEPSKEVLEAVELFNKGDWMGAHHVLDRLYMKEKGEMRYFCQALIQVGAALIHWERGNYEGALVVLDRSVQHLDELGSECQRVDVADLKKGAIHLRQALQSLGAERMAELDLADIPKLRLVGEEQGW